MADTRGWDHDTYAAYMRGKRGGDPARAADFATLKHKYEAWEVNFGETGGAMRGRVYAVFHKSADIQLRHQCVLDQLRSGGSVADTRNPELQWRSIAWGDVPSDLATAMRDHVRAGKKGLVPGDFEDPDPMQGVGL
jgi:hypothetical protein